MSALCQKRTWVCYRPFLKCDRGKYYPRPAGQPRARPLNLGGISWPLGDSPDRFGAVAESSAFGDPGDEEGVGRILGGSARVGEPRTTICFYALLGHTGPRTKRQRP